MRSTVSFPNYMKLRERSWIPQLVWHALRACSIIITLGLVLLLFINPARGLFWLWQIAIPVVPFVFFALPGLWRNLCPLAATNQLPRLFSFSQAQKIPDWLREYGFVISFTLFFLFASSRKWLFNESAIASALLILAALVAALIGGYFFKGKSGWCSSICPMLSVQRLYNQTPLVTVPNSHCSTCVGCTKNCYDFNPGVANLTDLNDNDYNYRSYRKFFAAAMAGFVLAYYITPDPPAITIAAMYGQMAMFMFISIGSFFMLDAFVKVSSIKLTTIYGALALNIYYWFNAVTWPVAMSELLELSAPMLWIQWAIRGGLLLLTAAWIVRTYRRESLFVEQTTAASEVRISSRAARALSKAADSAHIVTFLPEEKRVHVEAGRSLLEIAESNDMPIEPGCRMGVCGADPLVVLEGMENLSPIKEDERATLDRLGYANSNARMACKALVNGPVSISLDLDDVKKSDTASADDAFAHDESVKNVVIIGNGIAGVTAADHVRRRHPTCNIHLIGREKHHLYNRMGISRLIYGRTAMSGLYLMPDKWYDDHKIECWLNTRVTQIDPVAGHVELAVGDPLPYDRLILTAGSQAFTPPLPGFGLAGTFVLREAEDAMNLRAYVQDHGCRSAMVAGGGLLGLEAAYALHKLGVHVTVLERSAWLLRRQLDERGGEFLQRYLESLGLTILTDADSSALHATGDDTDDDADVNNVDKAGAPSTQSVQRVTLKNGQSLDCDLFLLCAGVRSDTQLAESAELAIGRGVVVDETMATSVPHIYAAGDVCEYDGSVLGLWPVAVEQARVAAINAVGGTETYAPIIPVTMLKVVGAELTSAGRFDAESESEEEIAFEDAEKNRYRKLVIAEGRIVGAILFGYPNLAPAITDAIKQKADVTHCLGSLRTGNWEILKSLDGAS